MALAGPSRSRPGWRHFALLHLIVLIWGITAVLGKLITLDPGVLTAWRTGLAAAILFGILTVRRQSWPGRRDLAVMLATGLLIGLHWFLFFLGGRLGTVSCSLAGASTMALWVALLEPLMVRSRRWSWAEGLLAAGVTSGVMIIQFKDRGLLTGILAAGVAALFSIINGRLVQRHSALVITALEMTSACALCVAGSFLMPPATGLQWWPAKTDWPWLLILAVVCTVFAYSACVWVQRRVSAFSLGMASNLEPIYGMALAPLVFGVVEHQSLQFYAGSAVIIGCVVLHTLRTAGRNPGREAAMDGGLETPVGKSG